MSQFLLLSLVFSTFSVWVHAAAGADSVSTPVEMPAGVFEVCHNLRADLAQNYPSLSLEAFQKQVNSVRDQYFPEMKNIVLHADFFSSDSDFLRANLDFKTIFAPPERRSYRIEVSPRLLAAPPSPAALDAILTHEIQHVRDYSQMSWANLAIFGIKYSLFPIAEYEHRTDEAVLTRGEGCHLIQYRLWLYAHEDGRAREEKIRDYYTPEDMIHWLKSHP